MNTLGNLLPIRLSTSLVIVPHLEAAVSAYERRDVAAAHVRNVRHIQAKLVHADAGDYRRSLAIYNRLHAAFHSAAENSVAVAYWKHGQPGRPLCCELTPVAYAVTGGDFAHKSDTCLQRECRL